MNNVIEEFKYNRHRSSTDRSYHATWRTFNNFIIRLDKIPRSWEHRVSLFCAYLVKDVGVQSSTLRSYVSAIKSKLTADNYDWNDKLVLLSAFSGACKLRNDTVRTRFPIKKYLLNLLLFELHRFYEDSCYLCLLYTAAFSVAYFGLLRVGEITFSEHSIKAVDVYASKEKQKILFLLRSSKTHGKNHRPQKIKITATSESKNLLNKRTANFCPFTILDEYNKDTGRL